MSSLDLFSMPYEYHIGTVYRTDSYRVSVFCPEEAQLRKIHVNGYALLHTSDPNTRLVGRIDRVQRLEPETVAMMREVMLDGNGGVHAEVNNEITVTALGTLQGAGGKRDRPFYTRAVETLPEIGAQCYLLTGSFLTLFTGLVSWGTATTGAALTLGSYTVSPEARAVLDGNALFQRHALIVGSTGSGKSWTAATIIEQAAKLPGANMIVFDVHGEYAPLQAHGNIARFRMAGPGDLEEPAENVLFLPYWLLGYEDMLSLMLDRSDENAPNQAMALTNAVIRAKQKALAEAGMQEEWRALTIDSPVPYDLDEVMSELSALNKERVLNPATNKENNGPFHGKFNRFLPRIAAKRSDRRQGFLFQPGERQMNPGYLDELAHALMQAGGGGTPGIKLVDFSDVPSDLLPIAVGLMAKLVFQVQQWSEEETRHPIALVCDEAHLYLPGRSSADAAETRSLAHFERIAKEGRKYGISLVIVSQRPSELNKTVASQCNNVIALRLSNPLDKAAVSDMLPEHLGGVKDVLPSLGIGEAIVVGDACLLPSRIKVDEPECKPGSKSVQYWDVWSKGGNRQRLSLAVRNIRRQRSGIKTH
ncbi:hypothetical protein PAE9249_05064 [Paenibacillus sp. CECT 9249]|uniref:ATP-binding protein n=1 Tax=Paenibacillus sp. CECT 9249 TaxID=2845385 RepID=UPI001E2C2928|nr:ATP-binding protein [Paenibacillus sp. CECT 9249]CAH0122504.1 hypothetical protein PAE9249_05064 [Paenibacillus sp. CECT 9249]